MTALSANKSRLESVGQETDVPVAAATHIYRGALVMRDTSGNAVPGGNAATDLPVGVALKQANNSSGSAADISVRVKEGCYGFQNSGSDAITKAQIGDMCYAEDDQTVAKTSSSGTLAPAGRVHDLRDGKVYVQIGKLAAATGDLVAANNLSDVAAAATARANIGANVATLHRAGLVLDAAATYYIPLPVACTITDIRTVVEGAAISGGAPTVTASIDATPITGGQVVIADASAVGTKDAATPSAANTATAGQSLVLVTAANSNAAAATASVTVEYTY